MPPQVRLRISEEPLQFLQRMDSMLREEDGLTVKSKLEMQGEHDHMSVGFRPEQHKIDRLTGMFVYWPQEALVLRIEAIARWEPLFPSYDVYVQAIKDLFGERLRSYNRLHRHRYRLQIPTKQSTIPKLTPKLKEMFDSFANLANKRGLHAFDWQRFYKIVVESYRKQPALNQDELRFHLCNAGFERDYADYLADAFVRCKDFYIEIDSKRRRAFYKG